ncbi:MAG: hypothetical protein AAF940_12875 [Pseudomonadota bacterium]
MLDQEAGQSPLWMFVLIAAAILFSFALACGMPFAALSALAALTLAPRNAIVLGGLGWLANQMIGFGFLGYPLDAMTLAWGIALGVSAIAAVGAGLIMVRRSALTSLPLRLGTAFLAAWIAQQATIFVASLLLGGTATAFAVDVVWFIFWTNALAFIVLLAAQYVGARFGLAHSPIAQGVV